LTLSKQIHNSLHEIQTRKNTSRDDDWIEVSKSNPSDLLLKRLTKEHATLLQKLGDSIKIYQTKSAKVPVEIKHKPKRENIEFDQLQLFEQDEIKSNQYSKQEMEDLRRDAQEIAEIFEMVKDEVSRQHEKVEDIAENIEEATIRVEDGTKEIQKASLMTGLGTTLIGGLIGGVVGGPVGAVVGFKLSLVVGVAAAGVTTGIGLLSGYFVAKKMNSINGANLETSKDVKKL
jgi:methyl-accepting chemotaxis protein